MLAFLNLKKLSNTHIAIAVGAVLLLAVLFYYFFRSGPASSQDDSSIAYDAAPYPEMEHFDVEEDFDDDEMPDLEPFEGGGHCEGDQCQLQEASAQLAMDAQAAQQGQLPQQQQMMEPMAANDGMGGYQAW